MKGIAGKPGPESFIGQATTAPTPDSDPAQRAREPRWYTAYTRTGEISQGRLEALLNFQTMVCDLTGMALAGASMLDEATAAAEAMTLAQRSASGAAARRSNAFFVADDVLPQTLDVLRTRAAPLAIEIVVGPAADAAAAETFAVLLQYPGVSGAVRDLKLIIDASTRAAARDRAPPARADPDDVAGRDGATSASARPAFGMPWAMGPHAAYLETGTVQSVEPAPVGAASSARRAGYRIAATPARHPREKATSKHLTPLSHAGRRRSM